MQQKPSERIKEKVRSEFAPCYSDIETRHIVYAMLQFLDEQAEKKEFKKNPFEKTNTTALNKEEAKEEIDKLSKVRDNLSGNFKEVGYFENGKFKKLNLKSLEEVLESIDSLKDCSFGHMSEAVLRNKGYQEALGMVEERIKQLFTN